MVAGWWSRPGTSPRRPPSCPWRRTAGPPGASSPAPRWPSRRPPLPVLLSASPAPPCRSCPGVVLAPPGPPSCPSRQIDKRQAPAPCGMPAALPCPSVPPAPSPPSCLPGPSALSFPPAALPLPPRCGRCASLCPSLQTDRHTAGARAPRGALPTAPAPWGREEGDALPLPPGRCALASSRWDVGSCGYIRGQ
jgi:hypothetical protein